MIKRSLHEKIKNRLEIDEQEDLFDKIRETACRKGFQNEIHDRILVNHIAQSRNTSDLGVIYQKQSKVFERYYKRLTKFIESIH